MNNNDTLKRIRYAFDYPDDKMIEIFAHSEHEVSREKLSNWMKKEEDEEFERLWDYDLALFLNGLIVEKRGKKDGPLAEAEEILNNNIVLRKLKIALNFKDDDVLNMLLLSDLKISKHELSAFFRKFGHKHYRPCKDQVLRNFLNGMQLKYRQNKVNK
ncbi:MAG: hypothetical protein ACI9J3_000985 [Parvicellaceae bacterium]|jgi:uncharacterized protein YehS (DUF1456 family)